MENLGAMAYSRYTGFREITDRDVLELHCIKATAVKFFKDITFLCANRKLFKPRSIKLC